MEFKIVVPVIIILILGTIFGLLATETWSPAWNPFKKMPSLVIEKAITKIVEAEIFKMTGEIEAEFQSEQEGTEPKIITTSLFLSQIIDKSEVGNPKASFDLDLKIGMEGLEANMKGEIRTSGGDVYIRITTLPILPFLSTEFFEQVKNQWFKADKEKLKQMTQTEEDIDQKGFAEDIKGILIGKEIFEIKKDLGQEQFNGIEVTHYLADLKKDSLKVLIPELLGVIANHVPEKEKAEYEKDLEKFSKDFSENFDELWNRISPIEFDFWVEKGNLWLRRMEFEKEIEYGSFETEDKGQINLRIDLKFSDFNKEVKIEIPKDYKPIEEFLPEGLFTPELIPEFVPELEFPSE